MPNHIQNRLTIIGSPERVSEIFSLIKGEDCQIDFEKIIPMPENIFRDNLSDADRAICELTNRPNWYDWSIKHWGTKWNAYSQNDDRNTNDTIFFQTAWSAPHPVIERLGQIFTDVEMRWDYADEDSGCNTGRIVCQHGLFKTTYPDNGSKDAWEIYFELHPDRKEDYELVGDTYRYKD